jgi:hypothetical protein
MCPILKKLSTKLQPFHEVLQTKDEMLASKKRNDIRVLEHLLSYLEYQFGTKVAGIDHRERADGERISNWDVEIEILHKIYCPLVELCMENSSLALISRYEMILPLLDRSLGLLNPWLTQLDLDASNRTDNRNDHQRNCILQELFCVEQNMAALTINSQQLDIAEGHCQRCLAYSRRYGLEGEVKTTNILAALTTYSGLRQIQSDYSGALPFAAEAYNLMVEAYDPVHFQVQEAAGVLIDILISKGDLYDAERYAQVTYGNLRDKKNGIDQEGEEMAKGAYNLANVIHEQKGDLIKAEELARESLRIRILVYGNNHNNVSVNCNLLAAILRAQGKLGDETWGLYKRSLAISIRNQGPDGVNTSGGNFNIGTFYHQVAYIQPTVDSKQKQLLLAKSHFVEALRIRSKIDGPTHPSTVNVSFCLNIVLRDLSLI